MRFNFDNNVCVILTPYRDNLGESWEESVVCYPVLGTWELVVGFDIDEKKPVEEWAINYLGHNQIAGPGVLDVQDWAAGYGHKLGTQTVGAMLPDKGLYVKRVWDCMMASNQVDLASEECWGISEQISQLEYQLEDLTSSSGRRQALSGELASLRDELAKATANLEAKQAEHEKVYGEDPTFEQID